MSPTCCVRELQLLAREDHPERRSMRPVTMKTRVPEQRDDRGAAPVLRPPGQRGLARESHPRCASARWPCARAPRRSGASRAWRCAGHSTSTSGSEPEHVERAPARAVDLEPEGGLGDRHHPCPRSCSQLLSAPSGSRMYGWSLAISITPDRGQADQHRDRTAAKPGRELLADHDDRERVLGREEEPRHELQHGELRLGVVTSAGRAVGEREADDRQQHHRAPADAVGEEQEDERRHHAHARDAVDHAPLRELDARATRARPARRS